MSMNNKQRWMGGVVLLGGGVLLAALLFKGNEEIEQDKTQTTVTHPIPKTETQPKIAQPAQEGEMVSLQPLAVDVETEKRLLDEQKRAREKAVAEQEARAAEFLKMQQEAEAAAARKAAEEYAAINARRTAAQESSDNIPPELVEDDQAKAQRFAEEKRKLEEKKKAEQQKVEQQKTDAEKKLAEDKRKAEADKKAEEDKRKAEADKKAAEEKKRKTEQDARKVAEDKRKAEAEKKAAAEEKKRKTEEDAKKKAEAEKARQLLENGDKNWMVQVALAANQANADTVVSKLRAKGYKVTTSPTSKGIRIMVGPSKDRETADAARKKITSDESLNMKSAWVIDWVPLDQR